MNLIKVKDYQEMSNEACKKVLEKMKELERPVLGLATGSTPVGMYERLIEEFKNNRISFKNVITFNLDEYVGLTKDNPASYHYFMMDKLFNHVDMPLENIHIPNGVAEDLQQECLRYEEMIREAGGIDLQILGIGLNGHIGFNEPGTKFTSRTHVVKLTESTRQANSRFFNSIDEVPTEAITMGIETIMESKEIILLVSGENKADTVARLLSGQITEEFPASVLHKHENVTVIADEAALRKCQLD